MLPLHRDPWFTFRFADDRTIPRFHLEGVLPGPHVSVIKIDPATVERLVPLATATVDGGGRVDLPQPITMRAGEGLVAVPILSRQSDSSVEACDERQTRCRTWQDQSAPQPHPRCPCIPRHFPFRNSHHVLVPRQTAQRPPRWLARRPLPDHGTCAGGVNVLVDTVGGNN